MASANLEFVRSLYADWDRGDYSSAAWAHPEVEFVVADGPSPGTWTGVAGMRDGWRGIISDFESHSTAAEEYRELDDERILTFIHVAREGERTEARNHARLARSEPLPHPRRQVTRLVIYLDRERTLADLGLAPTLD